MSIVTKEQVHKTVKAVWVLWANILKWLSKQKHKRSSIIWVYVLLQWVSCTVALSLSSEWLNQVTSRILNSSWTISISRCRKSLEQLIYRLQKQTVLLRAMKQYYLLRIKIVSNTPLSLIWMRLWSTLKLRSVSSVWGQDPSLFYVWDSRFYCS